MSYSYEFTRSPSGRLLLKLPKEIDTFADFIELIATEDEVNEYIQIIDAVKEGKHEQFQILLDAPMVTIKPKFTSVTLSEILDDPPPDQYIETDQFRELILIWKEKLPERFLEIDKED